MNPTSGPWTYDPDFREVQRLERIIAVAVEGQRGASEEEKHANGYLMAAAPNLRDELTNLSQAVRAHLERHILVSDIQEERLLDRVEVMLQRAEYALGHIFPPMKEHAPDCNFFNAQAAGMQRPSGACDCGHIDHDEEDE